MFGSQAVCEATIVHGLGSSALHVAVKNVGEDKTTEISTTVIGRDSKQSRYERSTSESQERAELTHWRRGDPNSAMLGAAILRHPLPTCKRDVLRHFINGDACSGPDAADGAGECKLRSSRAGSGNQRTSVVVSGDQTPRSLRLHSASSS